SRRSPRPVFAGGKRLSRRQGPRGHPVLAFSLRFPEAVCRAPVSCFAASSCSLGAGLESTYRPEKSKVEPFQVIDNNCCKGARSVLTPEGQTRPVFESDTVTRQAHP